MHITSAVFVKSCPDITSLPQDERPQIACLGRSNVGKSSLINELTGQRHLSHVSSTPGRTALLNVFAINHAWYLIDLPGYGFAKRSKDERVLLENMIYEYLRTGPTLALVIIDSNVGITELDQELLTFLETEKIAYIIIANKIDKQSGNQRTKTLHLLKQEAPHADIILHSNETHEGRAAILEAIATMLRDNQPKRS